MIATTLKLSAVVAVSLQLMACCCLGPSLTPEQRAQRDLERKEQAEEYAKEKAERQAAAAAAEKAKWDSLPETERKFCEAVDAAADAYGNASNDLKKSKARRDRAAAIKAAVPGGKVTKWSGKVDALTTTGDGNVVLQIRLPCDSFTVGTWNNELSDIGDNTLISASSSVYDTLAEMEVGEGITFSGRLIPEKVNGWKGTSITEYGSMTGEAFLLRF